MANIKKTYTYDEAIDKVLEIQSEIGRMPLEDDYEKEKINPDVLLNALSTGEECDNIWNIVIENHSKSYAGVNILTLRELRRRNDERVYIASSKEGSHWEDLAGSIYRSRHMDLEEM